MAKAKPVMVSAIWPGFDKYQLEGKLSEVITTLSRIYDVMPEEIRQTAYIDIESGGYDGYQEANIYYKRPENAEEAEQRVLHAKRIRESKRKQYEQLKKEFG